MKIRRWAALVALLVPVVVSSPARALIIGFNGPTTIAVGSTFTWDVVATGVFSGRPAGDEVVAFGFDVALGNPSLVSFVSAGVGPLFDNISLTPGTDVSGLALATINALTLVEPLLLASLTFQVLNAGTLSLGILSDLLTLNEGLFYLEDLFIADITTSQPVTVVTLVPGPPTHSLVALALGLIALTAVGRRR